MRVASTTSSAAFTSPKLVIAIFESVHNPSYKYKAPIFSVIVDVFYRKRTYITVFLNIQLVLVYHLHSRNVWKSAIVGAPSIRMRFPP